VVKVETNTHLQYNSIGNINLTSSFLALLSDATGQFDAVKCGVMTGDTFNLYFHFLNKKFGVTNSESNFRCAI
jgi:hypothetical protein